jgi:ribosome-associated translation inhibitor RaiA
LLVALPVLESTTERDAPSGAEAQSGQSREVEGFHPHITVPGHGEQALHHQQGRQFRVHIDVRVPGKEVVANRDHDEDVYVALRDAFDSVKRQLEETVRVRRGDVKVHETPQHGQ